MVGRTRTGRSRDRGLALSRRVGHHFSGNADLLGFGYNNDVRTDVLGFGDHQDARSKISVGPTILSMIDYRDRATLDRRFIVEEGAVPRAFVDALRRFGPTLALLQGRDTDIGLIDTASEIGRALRDQGLGGAWRRGRRTISRSPGDPPSFKNGSLS